jgi:hypothetical protein
MRVVEIQTTQNQQRYVLLDEEGQLVVPAVRYLKHLDQRGCARNTLRSYAHMLKLYFEYVQQRELDYRNPTLDDIGLFVHWLKLPSGSIKVLPSQPVPQARANRTLNHALTVITGLPGPPWRDPDRTLPSSTQGRGHAYGDSPSRGTDLRLSPQAARCAGSGRFDGRTNEVTSCSYVSASPHEALASPLSPAGGPVGLSRRSHMADGGVKNRRRLRLPLGARGTLGGNSARRSAVSRVY